MGFRAYLCSPTPLLALAEISSPAARSYRFRDTRMQVATDVGALG